MLKPLHSFILEHNLYYFFWVIRGNNNFEIPTLSLGSGGRSAWHKGLSPVTKEYVVIYYVQALDTDPLKDFTKLIHVTQSNRYQLEKCDVKFLFDCFFLTLPFNHTQHQNHCLFKEGAQKTLPVYDIWPFKFVPQKKCSAPKKSL